MTASQSFNGKISIYFNGKISISLHRDEAIVLYGYLTRELWGWAHEERLGATYDHPAESHAFHALLQELIVPLMDTGRPDEADRIYEAAKEHLMNRFR